MKYKTKPVKVGSRFIGDGSFTVWAGPCSLESTEQFSQVAQSAKDLGAHVLRGGIFKLRSDPQSFQGLGKDALEIAKRVKKIVGMPFVSEVTDPRMISDMAEVVDIFQVGSRNMHNYALLKELAGFHKPILLKRGFAANIKEWLLAAEYLIRGGNEQVILCERGIRTFETATRNTFDINAIAWIKAETTFPVLADPSHGVGIAHLVPPIALAAAAAGADGLLLEVHPHPSLALSDGYQSLDLPSFSELMQQLQLLLPALGRKMSL